MALAPEPADILRFAADQIVAGSRVALATLVGITGSSSRALGSQMAITERGDVCGSLSSGCVDAAVIAEARSAIANGSVRKVRFGEGSPYIDVRLPCGAGLDLLFTPITDPTPLAACLQALAERRYTSLWLASLSACKTDAATNTSITFSPRLRIAALGMGDELLAMVRISATFGAEVYAVTPDQEITENLRAANAAVIETLTTSFVLPELGDRWTAFVSLLHDRDWEMVLLPQMLRQDGFYHGAIGNIHNQALRKAALAAGGLAAADLVRLRGSIGLIPATRDPATLALSICAEVVSEYRRICQPPLLSNAAMASP